MIKVDIVTANDNMDLYGKITFTKGKTYVSRLTKNGEIAVKGNEGRWHIIRNFHTLYGKEYKIFQKRFTVIGWFLTKNRRAADRMSLEECIHAVNGKKFVDGTWKSSNEE